MVGGRGTAPTEGGRRLSTTTTSTRLDPAVVQVVAWLRLFVAPDQVTELRAIKVKQRWGRRQTIAGYFDQEHLDLLVKEGLRLEQDAQGVYFVLNPVDPALLARRYNGVEVAEE